MPTPYKCTSCSKTTMNSDWVCDDCKETAYLEGNSKIYQTVAELETRVEWLEKGLKQIKAQTLCLDDMIQSILDGEPTTADEENVVYISDINKEIAKEWKKEDIVINLKDRTREERIELERKHEEKKKVTKEDKTKYKQSMIQNIGYRGDD